MKLSVVIPAHNEEQNIRECALELHKALAEDAKAHWALDWLAGESAPA